MFKLEKKTTFRWPVVVNVPKDGGGFASYEFTGEFKLHDQSKMDTLLERFRQDDQDVLRELLIGWSGVQDSNGDELLVNDENRDTLIDVPYVRSEMLKEYFDAVSGNKVKKGN